jgi:hypothetical protein
VEGRREVVRRLEVVLRHEEEKGIEEHRQRGEVIEEIGHRFHIVGEGV